MRVSVIIFLELCAHPSTSTAILNHGAIIPSPRRSCSSAIRFSNGNGLFASAFEFGMTKAAGANDSVDGPRSSEDGSSSGRTEGVGSKQEQAADRPARAQWETKGSHTKGNQGDQKRQTFSQARPSPLDFDAQIIKLYAYPGVTSSVIDLFVNERLPKWTQREISTFMRISGKKSRSKTFLHLKRHLPSIASRIGVCTSSWKLRDISAILYGLQCLREDDDGYLAIIAVMAEAIRQTVGSGEAASAVSISLTLLGLQKNKLRDRQSIELLHSITIMIKSCKESLSAQEVGNALYGMKGMSSDHAEVRDRKSVV